MIYMTISVDIYPGKQKEAEACFQKIATYMRENTAEVSYQIVRNISGPTRKVHVFASYESIADWDASRAKRSADPNWHAIAAEVVQVVDLHNAEVNFYDVLAQA